MKKLYIHVIILILLAMYSQQTTAQISAEKGEYIPKTSAYAYPCDCTEGIPNFQFTNNGPNSISVMLENERRMQIARQRALRAWYNAQKDIMKKHIERRLYKSFPSYEAARNELFVIAEADNIWRNREKAKNNYDNKIRNYPSKHYKSLKDIKALKQRLHEIEQGNIDNPLYGDKKVEFTSSYGDKRTQTIYLKDIKNKYVLTNFILNSNVGKFEENEWQHHNNKYTYKKIMSLGSDIKQAVLNEKINYYNSFDEWDRLSLVQTLLNYEEFKKLNSFPYVLPAELQKFSNLDKGTQAFIESYAYKHREGGYSLFDSNYCEAVVLTMMKLNGKLPLHLYFDRDKAIEFAKIEHEKLKKEELDKLLGESSINANKAVDFFVDRFKNVKLKSNEIKWLNENLQKATIFLENKPQEGFLYPVEERKYLYEKVLPQIREGGKVVNFNDKLGINNYRERQWIYNHSEEFNKLNTFYNSNNQSNEAGEFVKGQVELEVLTQNIPWKPKTGSFKRNKNLKYTHVYSKGNTSYFKMEDGSIIATSGLEKKLGKTTLLDDKFKDDTNATTGEYYYTKLAEDEPWRVLILPSDNLAKDIEKLFIQGAVEGTKLVGDFIFSAEDIKILFTGKDFDGQQASKWKAAGFLLFAIVPGSKGLKAVKFVGKAADATAVVVKIGGGTLVVDTVKAGLKVVTQNNVVKFLNKAGDEIARVADNILTFNYKGFGGKIITTPNKTTTLIGRWDDLKQIWQTGLAKQGKNKGGLNILADVPDGTVAEKWLFNKKWLDDAIKRGDAIRVTADPTIVNNVIYKNIDNIKFNNFNDVIVYMKSFTVNSTKFNNLGFFGKEIYTLINKGYKFDPIRKIFYL